MRQILLTALYALLAALVLAAPLAASEQAVVEEVAPPAEPQVLSGELSAAEAAQPDEEPQPVVAKAAPGTVTISDFEFAPASITVDVGEKVTWTNAGPTPHSATGDSFDTEIFEEGESRSHTFSEAGKFAYICTPHPDMKGTVIVRAAATQGEDDDDSAAADTGAAASDDGSAPAPPPSSDTAVESTDVPTLPATGLDAGGLFALGAMTFALGVLLRRRIATG